MQDAGRPGYWAIPVGPVSPESRRRDAAAPLPWTAGTLAVWAYRGVQEAVYPAENVVLA